MTKEQENMQQNKKAKGTFIAIMCCACLLGGFLGGFGTWLQRGYDKGEAAAWLGERIGTIAGNGLPVLMVIASAIAFGYMAWALKKAKRNGNRHRIMMMKHLKYGMKHPISGSEQD